MRRGLKQGILAVTAGILLGALGMLVLLRWERQRDREPEAPLRSPDPVAAAAPDPAGTPTEPEPSPAPAPTPDRTREAEALLTDFLQTQSGGWDLCFVSLPEGEPVRVSNAQGPMVSASLIKLPIMGAVLERVESGELTAEETEKRLELMITVSDNTAANELIRLLGGGDPEKGMEAVNDWCSRRGCGDTRLNRLMLADNGLQNYTSAADCARLLGEIYRGECVSAGASQKMLELLLGQTVKDRLPRGLPEGTPIAHKTGDLIGLCWADAGIVFSPGGDYILVVISDGKADESSAKNAAAELSRAVYESMNPAA